MTSSEQASGKRNTSSLLVNSHFCVLETVNLLCFYLPPKVYFFSQKDWHTKRNVQTRSVLDITSVEVLKNSMRRGGKTQKGRCLLLHTASRSPALIPLLNREQWRRTSCCFWTCRGKTVEHTHSGKTAHTTEIFWGRKKPSFLLVFIPMRK